jgi:peptidoglycan/LPS O-acetylase OafA/YrhL
MAEAGLAPSGKIRFEALDGLRGLASLVVVLAHFCSATGVLMQWPGLFNAVLAVDTFFVLSGFVLAHSFLSRQQRGLPLAPVGLFVQRWVRLWVPFAAATLMAIGLRFGLGPYVCSDHSGLLLAYCQRWNTPETAGSLIKQLILFYSPNLNAPSWTLPVELLNSVLVPALVILLARSPGYVRMIAVLSLLSIILPIKLPDCLYLFAAGCALRSGLAPQNPGRWALPLIGGSYLLMLTKMGAGQDIQQLLMAPAAVASILAAQKHASIAAILSQPFTQFLGKLSFPMYLLHWPVLLALVPRFDAALAAHGAGPRLSLVLVTVAYLLCTVLLALPFEKIIDSRSIRWGRALRAVIQL